MQTFAARCVATTKPTKARGRHEPDRSRQRLRRDERSQSQHEARSRRDPRLRRGPSQSVLPATGLEARRRRRAARRAPHRAVTTPRPAEGAPTVQFTPPGSATSITFGTGLTTAAPGSAEASLTVSDIEAAHDA